MDAVLPHEGGTVAVIAVQPSTFGPGAYADDVRFIRRSCAEHRPAAIALEMDRFRAEWFILQEFGMADLCRVKEIPSLEEFERAFRDLLCSGDLDDDGGEGVADGDWDDAWEAEMALQALDANVPFPNDGEPAQAGARRAELDAVRRYLRSNPEARVWLIDRDARVNQPRVEAWAGAEATLSSVMGSDKPEFDTDKRGRTRTGQVAALKSPANDRLRKKVLNQERTEFMVGELYRRLGDGQASVSDGSHGLVFLLLASTHLENMIRRWWEPTDAERMAELMDEQGLGAFQSPDIMEMAMRTQQSWGAVLEMYDYFAESPYIGRYEACVALEAACESCQEDPKEAAGLLASPRLPELRETACKPGSKSGERAAARLAELEDMVRKSGSGEGLPA